ncbi:MAG: UbiA family prenyltransferase [Holosporales bacterium]|jgi:4-hydroxybenzoate polyprenyltransferase
MKAYIHLLRLDKPVGTLLLLWPCWWGLALLVTHPVEWAYGYFALGALLLRSAGCIINDLWDRHIDQRVHRTKSRPLSSGAVSVPQALFVLFLLLLAGLWVLMQFSFSSIVLGLAVVPLVIAYPLAKRFFALPQLILGLVFSWGALLAPFAAYNPDPKCLSTTCMQEMLSWPLLGQIPAFVPWLYAACVLWTLGYDTLYALQDIKDDTRLNLRSSARTFGRWVKPMIGLCYSGMIVCLILAVDVSGWNLGYFGGLLMSTMLILLIISFLVWVIVPLDTSNPTACGNAFRANGWLGMAIFIILFIVRPFYSL